MNPLKDFFKLESASGILLIIAAALALIVANSPLATLYDSFLNIPVAVQVGKLEIAKPLLLWANDGFMVIFFFLVGLELKREIRSGQLSKPDNIMLPAIGALGGMAIPAAIYVFLAWVMNMRWQAGPFLPRRTLRLPWAYSPCFTLTIFLQGH